MTARRPLVTFALAVTLLLGACQPAPAPVAPPPEGTITRPDLVGLIDWERDARGTVFIARRIETRPDGFFSLGALPDCAIYGDNRIVYSVPADEGGLLLAVDRVPDEQIRTFIEDMTVNYLLFNLRAGATALPPEELPPSYLALTVNINGESRTFDSIGGWDEGYYERVVERCRAVAVAPAQFVPESGLWVTVRAVEEDVLRPSLVWDSSAGIDLAEVVAQGGRTWHTGAGAVALWDFLVTGGANAAQLLQGESAYEVVLQVPGFSLDSPPAP
ncbi:MAG: hypothetical protein MUC99_10330 [Anaerolineae bacterium]|nr:hypothetical protein [Anaerolineae bacterium]